MPEPERLAAALGADVVAAATTLARAEGLPGGWFALLDERGHVDALIARLVAALVAHDRGDPTPLSPTARALVPLLPRGASWSRVLVRRAACLWLNVPLTNERLRGPR